MNTETYDVLSDGAVTLHCRSSAPVHAAKAVLFIVHGLGEHAGRYDELAEVFLRHDIAVFTFDHRGHGLSGGKKGHAKSIEQLVEDTENALMQCRNIFLDIPIFLYGHSMGGQIAASYLNSIKSGELSGAIISSAWFSLIVPPAPWLVGFSRIIKFCFPTLTLPNGLSPEDISSLPSEVDAYTSDPLVHNRISLSLFHSLYKNGRYLLRNASPASIPVLVCHGENDRITDPGGSEAYATRLGPNAVFKIWPKSRHEPHHDHDKNGVINFYVHWVLEHV